MLASMPLVESFAGDHGGIVDLNREHRKSLPAKGKISEKIQR
ncbi:hypothetical protein KKY_3885 [Pelagibacterium halotolerans B2]|uniref:Uncharacterized protein n=1 Tax=Pelagibacterium halotolerans (strain DSM 22347 / JCM 15775 / CGMCC 1.7692 / B2) TaxID=1082931 RepID=G4RDV5_PELHB|nr:hypothetical protein KKY_3885 [Pelagibacterium halotolerans B2]